MDSSKVFSLLRLKRKKQPAMQNNSVNKSIFHFLVPEFERPGRYTGKKIVLDTSLPLQSVFLFYTRTQRNIVFGHST